MGCPRAAASTGKIRNRCRHSPLGRRRVHGGGVCADGAERIRFLTLIRTRGLRLSGMIVHIRLFAVMAQDAGSAGVDLELPREARLSDVRKSLRERLPGMRWPKGTMWAVNQE